MGCTLSAWQWRASLISPAKHCRVVFLSIHPMLYMNIFLYLMLWLQHSLLPQLLQLLKPLRQDVHQLPQVQFKSFRNFSFLITSLARQILNLFLLVTLFSFFLQIYHQRFFLKVPKLWVPQLRLPRGHKHMFMQSVLRLGTLSPAWVLPASPLIKVPMGHVIQENICCLLTRFLQLLSLPY